MANKPPEKSAKPADGEHAAAAPATPVAAPAAPPTPPAKPKRPGVAVDFDLRKKDCGVNHTVTPPTREWIVSIYAFDDNDEPAPGAKFKIWSKSYKKTITVGTEKGERGYWFRSFQVTEDEEIQVTLMEGGKDRLLTLYGVSKKERKDFLHLKPLPLESSRWDEFWRGIMGDNR